MKLSEKLAKVDHGHGGAPMPTETKPKAPSAWGALKRQIRGRVLAEIGPKLYRERHTQAELRAVVRDALDDVLDREDVRVTPSTRKAFVEEIASDILGYGPLDPYLADPSVTEIMCNAHDELWVERAGVIERTEGGFTDAEHYRAVIEKIVTGVGRRIDESSPMVDARLPDGSRVNAIIPPLATHAPILTIRKFRAEPYQVKDLINLGTLSMELALFLECCVRGKQNLIVSGGTGTGKTTLLNVVSSFIPEAERIVTIEDAAELRLMQPHVCGLESRPANAESRGEVTIRDLVRNALRMRPDRIVVGEARGGEALDMLQAMNTGHEGSLTTIHANSPRDTLSRIETMVLMSGLDLPVRAIREQIASGIDLIVHLERTKDGQRRVTEVTEVQGMEGDVIILQTLFDFDYTANKVRWTGLRPHLLDELEAHGVEIPPPFGRATGRSAAKPATRPTRMSSRRRAS
jgi:pilus assembly protein CpaF